MSDSLHEAGPAATPAAPDADSQAFIWFLEFMQRMPDLARWDEFETWLALDPKNEQRFIEVERRWKEATASCERAESATPVYISDLRESKIETPVRAQIAEMDLANAEFFCAQPRIGAPDCLTLGNVARRESVAVFVGSGATATRGAVSAVAVGLLSASTENALPPALKTLLKTLASTMEADSAEWPADKCAAMHLILGAALQLHAQRAPVHERTAVYIEAIYAFEVALSKYLSLNVRDVGVEVATSQREIKGGASSSSQQDGVQMALRAATLSVAPSRDMLARAFSVFADSAASIDCHEEPRRWVIARSNMACALTMLGQRARGMEGVHKFEEAIDVLREAADVCIRNELVEERAAIYVNLCEAYQGLADPAMPGERLRYTEQALNWINAAVCLYAPEQFRWILDVSHSHRTWA